MINLNRTLLYGTAVVLAMSLPAAASPTDAQGLRGSVQLAQTGNGNDERRQRRESRRERREQNDNGGIVDTVTDAVEETVEELQDAVQDVEDAVRQRRGERDRGRDQRNRQAEREERRQEQRAEQERRERERQAEREERRQEQERRERERQAEREERQAEQERRERERQAEREEHRQEQRAVQERRERERQAERERRREDRPARRDREREAPRADERAIRDFLSDTRSADSLSEAELRRRVETARELLQSDNLDQRTVNRLRERLASDREDLRRRVDTATDRRDRPRDRAERDRRPDRDIGALARSLLDDNRPSSRLDDRTLRQRIQDIERVLRAGNLRSRDERRLQAMLNDDRAMLERRLREARRDRRERRTDRRTDRRRDDRRGASIRIEIAPGIFFAPRPVISAAEYDDDVIYGQLSAGPLYEPERRYSMRDVKTRQEVREMMPAIDLDTINFGFDEYWIRPEEIEKLDAIGIAIEDLVWENPDEVVLLEGHTDAVGSQAYNLELSRKRAEAVKAALLEYYDIEPHNLETVGYGKAFLKIPTPEAEPENRRVTARRITPLVTGELQ